MTLRTLFLTTAAFALPSPLLAQAAPSADPVGPEAMVAAPTADMAAEDQSDDPIDDLAEDGTEEGEVITVTGQRPRGSVVGDIPPENILTSRDVRATGATSISELLDAVAAQTGSARGAVGGRPILLLNGQRISGFRELRDLPPEAIERMEILPEEVALKYGYAADQRVVNIVLRRRFNSTSVEVGGKVATDGGYASGRGDVGTADHQRRDADLAQPACRRQFAALRKRARHCLAAGRQRPDPVDPRPFRTLVGANQLARLTATANRTIFGDVSATLTGEAEHSQGRVALRGSDRHAGRR